MKSSVNAPVKEKIRMEIDKLREMTFKEKIEYIWEYYKYHIIGLAIFVFVLVSLLNFWVFNPNPDEALFISWNAGFATDEQIDDLTSFLEERLIDEDVNEKVVIAQYFYNSDDPTVFMANVQRTVAMIAAGVIDLFVLDMQLLEEYSDIGYLQPLDNILTEVRLKNPEVFSRIEENIIYTLCDTGEGIKERRVTGVKIGNSPLFSNLGMFEQELFLGVSITAGKMDNIVKTFIMFFE